MRRLIGILLGVIVVIAAVSAVWTYLAGERGASDLVVTEIDGEVVITSVSGAEDVATPGRVLAARERVKTGEASSAVLALGGQTRIRLGSVSSVQVRSVDDDEVRLELENGALRATVRPGSGAVRIGSQGREVIATNGVFEMGTRGDIMQVSAVEGELMLSGVEATRLASGEQATVVERQVDIEPALDALLLQVQWPEVEPTRQATALVTGRTSPGAEILLSGLGEAPLVATAGADGSFSMAVPLGPRGGDVSIQASDLLGRSARAEGSLPERDTTVAGAPDGPPNYGPP